MIARITLSTLQYTQTFQNVFHITNGEGGFDKDAINSAIQTYWIAQVKTGQLSSIVYKLIQIRRVSVIGDPTWNFAVSITASGGSAIETWGPLCQLYSFHTLTPGRTGRGRYYLSGQYGGDVQANQWSSARYSAMATLASNLTTRWLGASPTSGYNLCVCSRESLPTAHYVTEIVPQPVPGVQRRRNYGVGI
jgi:hypothetical protein